MYFKVLHRASIKHQTRNAPSTLEAGGIDMIKIDKELPLLTMDKIEKQYDANTKYFDED